MTISLACKHCGVVIAANDEDQLVARVQAHVGEHASGHVPSREQILTRLHARAPATD